MADRTFEVHKSHSEAKDKFDHFVLAMIVAVIAFLGKDMEFKPLGHNIETVFLLSLIVFGLAAVAGFKRIEYSLEVYRLNFILLEHERKQEAELYQHCASVIQTAIDRSVTSYRLRNTLFGLGAICFLSGKVLAPYMGT